MKTMREWIQGHELEWVDTLIADGFKAHQAYDFVHETGKSVLKTIRGDANLDLHRLSSPTNLIAFFNRTDIGGVARRVGVPEDAARDGLKHLLPQLLQRLDEQAGRHGGIRPMVQKLDGSRRL